MSEASKLVVVAKATEEIESHPPLKARVIDALKRGIPEIFKAAIDHSLANILMATLEGFYKPE